MPPVSSIVARSKRVKYGSKIPESSNDEERNGEKLKEKELERSAKAVIPQFSSSVSQMITIAEEAELQDTTKKQAKDLQLVESMQAIHRLKMEIKKLTKDYKKVIDKERVLMKENNTLKEKLVSIRKAKKASDSLLNEKVETLKKLVEKKDTDVEWLWSEIQMLDDEHTKLKRHGEKWEESKKLLTKEIIDLRFFIANTRRNPKIKVSSSAVNWKEKMDKELSVLGAVIRPSHRWKDFSSLKQKFRGKLGDWIPRRMKKPGWYPKGKFKKGFSPKKRKDKGKKVQKIMSETNSKTPSKLGQESERPNNNKSTARVSALSPHQLDC
jgi:hypothetical protein